MHFSESTTITNSLAENDNDSDDEENEDNEDKRTIYCGNLSEKVTEELLCELFIQGGPVESVSIPVDKNGRSRNFGFVRYVHRCSVPYALALFDNIRLYNRVLNIQSRNNGNNSNQRNIQPPPLNFNFNKDILSESLIRPLLLPPPLLPPPLSSTNIVFGTEINQLKFDNSALRLGNANSSRISSSSNANFNNDMNLIPSKSDSHNSNKSKHNPFKIDFEKLEHLGGNMLPFPNEIDSKSHIKRDDHKRSNDLSNRERDKDRNKDKIRKHTSSHNKYDSIREKNHPYKSSSLSSNNNSNQSYRDKFNDFNEKNNYKQKRRI